MRKQDSKIIQRAASKKVVRRNGEDTARPKYESVEPETSTVSIAEKSRRTGAWKCDQSHERERQYRTPNHACVFIHDTNPIPRSVVEVIEAKRHRHPQLHTEYTTVPSACSVQSKKCGSRLRPLIGDE